jgi:hypothetical protein
MLCVFTVWVNCSVLADLIKITHMVERERKKLRRRRREKNTYKNNKKRRCYYKSRILSLFISAAVLSLSC